MFYKKINTDIWVILFQNFRYFNVTDCFLAIICEIYNSDFLMKTFKN